VFNTIRLWLKRVNAEFTTTIYILFLVTLIIFFVTPKLLRYGLVKRV
jgi:hypothetical protein